MVSEDEGNVPSQILLEIRDELRMIREAQSQDMAHLTASITSLGAVLLSVLHQRPPTVVISPRASTLSVSPATLHTPHVAHSRGVSGPATASEEESTGAEDLHIVVMNDEDGE